MTSQKIVVIDNGADKIKWGFADQPESLKNLGNYIAKSKHEKSLFIGDVESARNKDGMFFRRPFDRGYPINWDTEKEIWDFAFDGKINPAESHLLLTEPLFTPDSVKKVQNEMIFEDYGFQAMFNTSAPVLSMYNAKWNSVGTFASSPCQLVVDCGYSFTHVVPFFDNQKINYAVRRINIGGKALTNSLKELVSYRQWNVMEETYLMNMLKEKLCYVSLNFLRDLDITQKKGKENTVLKEFVLPDYIISHTGYVKGEEDPPQLKELEDSQKNSGAPPVKREEQILRMNNERIAVPELLFNPSYTGINQAGIGETIAQSIEACHPDMHAALYANIIVTGGCTKFRNFKERLEEEVRKFAPNEYNVNIIQPDDPVNFAWYGGCQLPSKIDWNKHIVTKSQYAEYGHDICKHKFFN